jgi:4-aminobutyrate aminotransferase-like enzyme
VGKLRALQKQFPLIGDVRGLGLMIGIELVAGKEHESAAAQAEAIRDSCLKKGVLIGVGGVYGNVIRIQPPLIITREEIDTALKALAESVDELSARKKAAD